MDAPAKIDVLTLTEGGQDPATIAARLARFFDEARTSLDLAVYDVRLTPAVAAPIRSSLESALGRGVRIRFAYNAPMDVPNGPPPPRTDPALIEGLGVPAVGLPGVPDLMHHKYVVRDRAAVWTGSTNWTDDSWSREENVLCTVASPALALVYEDDFEQLWRSRDVARSGRVSSSRIAVDAVSVTPWFAPGRASALVHRVAAAIGHATRRVRIASPVITSGPILGTLGDVADAGRVDLGIMIDATQVHEVLGQWAHSKTWKRAMLERVARDPRTRGKRSIPWGPTTIHDFMHAKVTVADDTVFLGSFNLSRSGESNAEDVLEIASPALAERLAAFIDSLRARYPAFS
jgi:phosphatidylserine/phosphatidylglycerophosphate/cardiolipin synthase-like enzyme